MVLSDSLAFSLAALMILVSDVGWAADRTTHQAQQNVATQSSGHEPAWQHLMRQARQMAAAGKNTVLIVTPLQAGTGRSGGVYVFYNNPRPFCYTYMIPGNWVGGSQRNLYRSTDGSSIVGVSFRLAQSLEGVEGSTLVEREANAFKSWVERVSGQPASKARLVPFESARAGTWKWMDLPKIPEEAGEDGPTRITVDLSPDAVIHMIVGGTADDDALARRVIETLRITKAPECHFPLLEEMLRSMHGAR